jgi:hypothetical protein
MPKPTILVWVVTVERRQGWLCDGDAISWDIAKARTFNTLEDARNWLVRHGLSGIVLIAVN